MSIVNEVNKVIEDTLDEKSKEIARLKSELMELRDVDLHSAHERIKDLDKLHGGMKATLKRLGPTNGWWNDGHEVTAVYSCTCKAYLEGSNCNHIQNVMGHLNSM